MCTKSVVNVFYSNDQWQLARPDVTSYTIWGARVLESRPSLTADYGYATWTNFTVSGTMQNRKKSDILDT